METCHPREYFYLNLTKSAMLFYHIFFIFSQKSANQHDLSWDMTFLFWLLSEAEATMKFKMKYFV